MEGQKGEGETTLRARAEAWAPELGLVGDAKGKQGGMSRGGQDDSGVGVPGLGLGAVEPDAEGVERDLLEGETAVGREGVGKKDDRAIIGGRSMATPWGTGVMRVGGLEASGPAAWLTRPWQGGVEESRTALVGGVHVAGLGALEEIADGGVERAVGGDAAFDGEHAVLAPGEGDPPTDLAGMIAEGGGNLGQGGRSGVSHLGASQSRAGNPQSGPDASDGVRPRSANGSAVGSRTRRSGLRKGQ